MVWNYSLIGPTLPGRRCVCAPRAVARNWDGESGTTCAFNGVHAAEPFTLYLGAGGGRLIPALKAE